MLLSTLPLFPTSTVLVPVDSKSQQTMTYTRKDTKQGLLVSSGVKMPVRAAS